MALSLMASDGLGLDAATARALVKDKIRIPRTTQELRHHLNNWCGIIVFGSNSLIATEMGEWTKHIDRNERSYDDQMTNLSSIKLSGLNSFAAKWMSPSMHSSAAA